MWWQVRGFGSVSLLSLAGFSACQGDFSSGEPITRVGEALFNPQGRLVPAEGDRLDHTGWSVAVSGDTALLGAVSDEQGTGPGVVKVFTRSGGTWTEQEPLNPVDAVPTDEFGRAVALSGDVALVGAALDDEFTINQGSVYVFVRSGGTWTQTQKLTAFDRAADDYFGSSVAIAGDTALVGAYGDDDGTSANEGAVYVFTRTGSVFNPGPKLVANDGSTMDSFGSSIAFDGSKALIGAPGDDVNSVDASGAAYVFTVASGWQQTHKLLPPTPRFGSVFGRSVAISGDHALVGEPGFAGQTGWAHAYNTSGWVATPLVPALTPVEFGWAVAVTGNHAIVSHGAGPDGSAVVFTKNFGTPWVETETLRAESSSPSFAYSIAADNGTLVMGAPYDVASGQTDRGSAYALAIGAPDGTACDSGSECSEGNCVEGVCCNDACTGGCDSCLAARTGGSDGTCAPVLAGADPKSACSDAGEASCGTSGACDGDGDCALYPAGTACAESTCSGTSVQGYECTGEGDCEPVLGGDCTPFRCDAGACSDPCGASDDCVAGYFCSLGLCTPTLGAGAPCSADGDCSEGHCVDEVCCESACDGSCEACSTLVKGSGDDGSCEPVVAGADPDGECSEQASDSCGRTGQCDGAGACQLRAAGTSCGSSTCDNATARGRLCDGAGACVNSTSGIDCAPYACSDGACRNPCVLPEDCLAGNVCIEGTCLPPGAEGTPCATGSACTSGQCADGVCCDGACTGLCVACSAAVKGQGADGVCGPIRAALDPENECAREDPSTCGQDGECSGDGACARWTTGTECGAGSCEASVATNAARCDAEGTCMPGAEQNCAIGYLCDGSTCATACSDDSLCESGYHCDAALESCVKDPEPGGTGGTGGTSGTGGTAGEAGEAGEGGVPGSAGAAGGEGGVSEPGAAGTSGAGRTSGGGAGAAGSSAGTQSYVAPPTDDGGCGCRVARRTPRCSACWWSPLSRAAGDAARLRKQLA